MTASGLILALVIGVVMGAVGHLAVPRGRVPFWVTLSATTGAVLLGTIVARMAGIGVAEFSIAELVIQLVFGAIGIVTVAGTADRRPTHHQDRPV
jgi:hypothetical protein